MERSDQTAWKIKPSHSWKTTRSFRKNKIKLLAKDHQVARKKSDQVARGRPSEHSWKTTMSHTKDYEISCRRPLGHLRKIRLFVEDHQVVHERPSSWSRKTTRLLVEDQIRLLLKISHMLLRKTTMALLKNTKSLNEDQIKLLAENH